MYAGVLDVAVGHAVGVGVAERVTSLGEKLDGAPGGHRAEARDQCLEVEPLEVLHRVVEVAVGGDSGVIHLNRVWRAQRGGGLCFALEAQQDAAHRVSVGSLDLVFADQFDGSRPGQRPVAGPPHFAHAAAADQLVQVVKCVAPEFVGGLEVAADQHGCEDRHGGAYGQKQHRVEHSLRDGRIERRLQLRMTDAHEKGHEYGGERDHHDNAGGPLHGIGHEHAICDDQQSETEQRGVPVAGADAAGLQVGNAERVGAGCQVQRDCREDGGLEHAELAERPFLTGQQQGDSCGRRHQYKTFGDCRLGRAGSHVDNQQDGEAERCCRREGA